MRASPKKRLREINNIDLCNSEYSLELWTLVLISGDFGSLGGETGKVSVIE